MSQTTDTILMIRPVSFGYNPETAINNAFQVAPEAVALDEITIQAKQEFDQMVAKLADEGIEVIVVEDTPTPVKPDAVFPNNWVSFHHNNLVITYPMYAANRRIERRESLIKDIMFRLQRYDYRRLCYDQFEAQQQFLEGTGSMLLDRVHQIVYACISPRTDQPLLQQFASDLELECIAFNSVDRQGDPIYHTNVMMALGTHFAAICLESIWDEEQRNTVVTKLQVTQKDIIELSYDEMEAFAGNMLEVKNKSGEPVIVLSQTAYDNLSSHNKDRLELYGKVLPIPIPTIEKYGGGSVRCMMAEVF